MPHSLATCWAIFVATNGPPLIRAWSLPTGIASVWPGGNPTSPPSLLHLQRRLHRGASKRSIWPCWRWSGLQREKGACARTLCRLSHMLQPGGNMLAGKTNSRGGMFFLKKQRTCRILNSCSSMMVDWHTGDRARLPFACKRHKVVPYCRVYIHRLYTECTGAEPSTRDAGPGSSLLLLGIAAETMSRAGRSPGNLDDSRSRANLQR